MLPQLSTFLCIMRTAELFRWAYEHHELPGSAAAAGAVPGVLHLSPYHQLPPAHCVSSCFSHVPTQKKTLQLLAYHRASVRLLHLACIMQILCAYTDSLCLHRFGLCAAAIWKRAGVDHFKVVAMAGSHLHNLRNAMCVCVKSILI